MVTANFVGSLGASIDTVVIATVAASSALVAAAPRSQGVLPRGSQYGTSRVHSSDAAPGKASEPLVACEVDPVSAVVDRQEVLVTDLGQKKSPSRWVRPTLLRGPPTPASGGTTPPSADTTA